MRPNRDTGLLILLLLLILAIAAGLRFYQLDAQSLWADEGNSAALAARSLGQITRDAANDIHPPLYYWLLHLWTGLFGHSEAALRSLSALLGVLLVLTTAELGRRIYGVVTGLLAGLVAAVAPFQVYYSQEARMYILLALVAAVSMLVFWWLLSQEDRRLPAPEVPPGARKRPSTAWPAAASHSAQDAFEPQAELHPPSTPAETDATTARPRVRWLPFSGQMLILSWIVGLYTHYAFPLMIALASGLYALWLIYTWRRGCGRQRILRWFIFLGITLGLYAPWLGTAIRQLMAWPAPTARVGILEQIRTLLTTTAFGTNPAASVLPWVAALCVLALLGALPWPHLSRRDQLGTGRMDWLRCLLPLAWLLAPIAMILVLGLFRGAYLKFLLIGSPAFVLLLARGVTGPAGWLLQGHPSRNGLARNIATVAWTTAALAMILATSGAAVARYLNEPATGRDDYRGISQFIIATAQANDAVLLDAPGQREVFDYYYQGDLPVYPLPRQRPIDAAQTQAELEGLLDYDKVYALYWGADEADPEGVIENWLDQRGYKTLDQWHGNVRLAVYVMPEHRAPDEQVDDLNATLSNGITLQGYQGWNLTPVAGEVTQVQLQWRADQALDRRYKVFLQLLDQRDQVIAQRDAEPAGESRPTTTWQPGEVVLDNHGVLIPPGTPPGSYRRIVGMYDAETLERVKLPDGSNYISLSPVNVQRTKTPPALEALAMQNRQSFDFGAVTLLGHDRYKRGFGHAPETMIKPGDLLHLTFYWRANAAPRADWWFELALTDPSGKTVAQLSAPLVSETYSTTMWQEGEIIRGEHDLPIPADLAPDTYRLSLTLLPDQHTPAGSAYLGSVRVQ